MNPDIHDYNRKLEQILKKVRDPSSVSNKSKRKCRIDYSSISPRNRKMIIKFHCDCIAEGMSLGRVLSYVENLAKLASWLEKDFTEAKVEDIKSLVSRIEKSDYSYHTKYGLKLTLKKFYQWLRGEKNPPEVSWFKLRKKANERKLPEDLLTEADVKRMIEVADNPRDRALVSVLYESGCRIGEVLTLRIKDVKFDKFGACLVVNGKTGTRRVRIVASAPYLAEWINKHPQGDDLNSWLWLNKRNKILKLPGVIRLLNKLKVRAGIKKKIYPYNFRHSRATYLANHLTEAQMREYFGWVKNSDTPSIYVHLSGRDIDNAILKTYGVKNDEEKESKLKPKSCLRCGETNPATNKFCSKCGMILDKSSMIEMVRKDLEREEADRILDRLLEDAEFKEVFMKKIREVTKS